MRDEDTTKEQLIAENEELRRQVAALEASEQRFRTIIDTVPLTIGEINRDGVVVFTNAATEKMYGYTPEEMIGSSAWDRIEEGPTREAFRAWFSHTMSDQPSLSPVFGSRVKKNGERIEIRGDCNYLRNKTGEVTGLVTVVADITDLKRAEEELAKSKAILTAAVECLPFDFFALDPDGRCILQNAVSRRYYGDALGKTTEDVCPDPRNLARWLEKNQRAFAGERVEGDVELAIRGEQRHVHNIITPIRDGDEVLGILGVNVDVTDRKRAEEALQKAHDELERRVEERTAELAKANEELAIFRSFAEASGQGFSMADLDGHLIYLNPALCRMLGEERPEVWIGQHLSICYSEESNRRGKQEIEPALMREGYWQGELSMLSRQGKSIPTWHNSFLIRDDSGSPLRLAVVITDITERKAAEEALRASEERFRVTFEEAPVGMVIGVGDGVITKANRAVCRMIGYTEEELVGRHVRDLAHPEDRDLSGPLVKRLLAGEIPSFTLERRYLRKGGQPFWAQATTAAIQGPDGKVAFALGVVEDIDHRKRAVKALRQSERRFRNYFEQGLIGMAVTSVDKRWLEVNDRLCEIMGYSREELLQKTWPDLTYPDDLEPNIQLLNRLLAGEIEHFTLNKRYLKKDGSIVHATIHTRAFRKDDGTIDHIVTLVEDITARRQAQAALERERRTLKHMLRASDHERQLIAYDIHDGLAQELAGALMQFEFFDHLKEANSEQATDAFHAAMTMLRQGHMEARRLISGVRPPILDESGVVAAIAHLVYDPTFAQGPKIDLRNRVTFGRLPSVLENVIYRIVQEGLTNARHHSKSDKVLVSLKQRGDRLRIEIRDWGVGFDPTVVQENRFGLEGIRERARLLGGKYSIKSKPGKGTSIVVELSVVEQQQEE